MCALVLAQRASILRFSKEIAYISNLNEGDLSERVRELYKPYLLFSSQMYFTEVSAQEQGIELYDMLQENMRIKEGIRNLDVQINELHQYATLIEEENKEKKKWIF